MQTYIEVLPKQFNVQVAGMAVTAGRGVHIIDCRGQVGHYSAYELMGMVAMDRIRGTMPE